MSVYCSWCHKRGHNRRGCPERKADAAANPASSAGYEERYYKRAQKDALDTRACSYCREKGHTRRTCPALKADVEKIIQRQTEYRKAFIDEAASAGLGPGAIVTTARGPQWYGAEDAWNKTITSIIVKPSWQSIDFLRVDGHGSNWVNSTTFVGRIVKTAGYDEGRSSSLWGEVLRSGDATLINSEDVLFLMEHSHNIHKDWVSSRKNGLIKILSPSYKKYTLPETDKSSITDQLNNTFHLFPKTNASPALKRREDPGCIYWRNIDRKAYLEHMSSCPKRMRRMEEISTQYEENYGRSFL